LEIELLKTFQKVVENGSISKTADEMYLSVSTVTSRIKKLEGQLKIELFHRNGRRLDISVDGRRFLKVVERFFSLLDEGREKVSSTNQEYSGRLNLVVSSNITNYILPQLIRKFNDLYPQIQVNVVQSSNYKLVDRLSNGHMELGIANHIVNEGGLKSQLWFKDRIVPVLPKDHPLATKEILCPQDIE
jgi:LysR family transcriptional regulator for metE and metH